MTDSDSLQQAIDEEVALVAFNPQWPALFEAERERLMRQFPSQLIEVQHIGSTAVAGLRAKPVIDLMAGMAAMAVAQALIEPLCNFGYTTSAAFNQTLTDRKWLMRWANGHRSHHLHLVVYAGPVWFERLRFRDMLRSDAALAQHYSRLKDQLAAAHIRDREAYTEGKAEFIRSVLEKG